MPRDMWSSFNLLWVGFGQETQQQKEKTLRKALACERAGEAIKLLKRINFDVKGAADKYGLEEQMRKLVTSKP